MHALKVLAENYGFFTRRVREKMHQLYIDGWQAVRPTWVDDDGPFLAYIDASKATGERLRLKAVTGNLGSPVVFVKE